MIRGVPTKSLTAQFQDRSAPRARHDTCTGTSCGEHAARDIAVQVSPHQLVDHVFNVLH